MLIVSALFMIILIAFRFYYLACLAFLILVGRAAQSLYCLIASASINQAAFENLVASSSQVKDIK